MGERIFAFLMGVVLIGAWLLIGYFSLDRFLERRETLRDGTRVEGTVLSKHVYVSTDSDGDESTSYTIVYRYPITIKGESKLHVREENVFKRLYNRTEPTQRMDVLYIDNDPETVVLAANRGYYLMEFLLGFLGLIFGFWGAYLVYKAITDS
jgi:hypothetical protein